MEVCKLLKIMAEGTGLEPACPCGRRFSRPLHYQLCDPSALRNYILAETTSQLARFLNDPI